MSCIFKQPAISHSIAGQRANQDRVLPSTANAILPRATSLGDATGHYGIVSQNGAAPRPRLIHVAYSHSTTPHTWVMAILHNLLGSN